MVAFYFKGTVVLGFLVIQQFSVVRKTGKFATKSVCTKLQRFCLTPIFATDQRIFDVLPVRTYRGRCNERDEYLGDVI